MGRVLELESTTGKLRSRTFKDRTPPSSPSLLGLADTSALWGDTWNGWPEKVAPNLSLVPCESLIGL